MSILKVDTINEKTSGNGVYIPGHVIQVLTQEITAHTTTSSTSSVATGFTLTITPKSTASKIKCTVGFSAMYAAAITSSASFYLHKNGSFHTYLHSLATYANPVAFSSNPTIMTVDSPNTTSAVTYAIFWARTVGTAGVYFNNYGPAVNQTRSWFTVEEIAQ